MRNVLHTLVACAVMWGHGSALGAPPVPKAELISETLMLVVETGDGPASLETLIVRPPGPGPFPLAIIAHGGTSAVEGRTRMTPQSYRSVAEEFARRGYAAVFALRGGYGKSSGQFIEIVDRCNPGRAELVGRAVAGYIRGTIEAARRLPFADPNRVLVIGQSMGGLGSVALSAEPPAGVMAIVNFAGGIRYGGMQCEQSWVADDFGTFGRTARTPSLWIYTENDSYFPPNVANQFHSAYTRAGGIADLRAMPAHGNDGHGFILAGIAHWRSPVDAFLNAKKLPNWDSAPNDLRLLAAPTIPPALATEAQKAAWARYLEGAAHRAFAVGTAGRTNFGYATGRADETAARTAAIEFCERNGRPCRVVASDEASLD